MLEEAIYPPLLRNMAIALFIGALVGLDREHKVSAEPGQFGGLRTFMLIAMIGAVCAWISEVTDSYALFIAGLLAISVLLGASYVVAAPGAERPPGLTSEVAAIVTYLLGGLCVLGHPELAVAFAIVTSGVLAYKQTLHDLARRIGPDDLAAGLKLLFATFIVLPLLPNEALDPWGALNPYRLWWLVILISALSLVGYVAVRALGERRGLAVTGFFGGLVSSTAVTLSLARSSRAEGAHLDALSAGVLLAWAVMAARVIVEVAVVNPGLLRLVAPPVLAMGLGAVGVAGAYWRRARSGERSGGALDVQNPFNLVDAVKFGLFFALVLLAVELARTYVSNEWLYVVAALAGTTDVDAITLSMAGVAGESVPAMVAARAIVLAAVVNTVVKTGMVLAVGTRDVARRVSVATGIAVAVAAVWLALTWRA